MNMRKNGDHDIKQVKELKERSHQSINKGDAQTKNTPQKDLLQQLTRSMYMPIKNKTTQSSQRDKLQENSEFSAEEETSYRNDIESQENQDDQSNNLI